MLPLAVVAAALCLTQCSSPSPKQPSSKPVSPPPQQVQWRSYQSGGASWYGGRWHGRKTANGERYNQLTMTAAHKTLPFNSMVKVTNLSNGHWCVVRINNRGPYIRGRVIDVSVAAAKQLGFYERGLTRVKLEVPAR